ncbi:hypothetical protein EV652_104273 [Kribbella steppae]|uniref:Uncharacterized protein n=1 Tax=Kribbella steppae TaxID=2512223 RepID=A0A4R2HNP9_9ACTN|nr:hypothetical protein [Kribbella steppae]TCO32667.1 hypothetical protein EV652_104273 [Kribbella steppae]
MWLRWILAGVGISLIRFLPPRLEAKPTVNWPATVRWESVIPVAVWLVLSCEAPLAPEGE